jgi:hypothetical protein
LEALRQSGAGTVSLGPSRDLSDRRRRIEASLSRAAIPTPDPASRLELQGGSRLRGLVGAADLLLHELAVDAGRLAMIERDRNSRRKLLADQRLKRQKLSESLQKSGADRALAERTAADVRNATTRTDRLQSEQDQARISSREVLDQMAAEQDQFLRAVAAARDLIGETAKHDDGTDAGSRIRGGNPAPASSRGPSHDPSTQPYARRLTELEKVVRSEKVAVDVDKGLIWVDATIGGSRRLKVIVEPKAEGLRLAAATAIEAGIRPVDGEPAVAVEAADGRMLPARWARLDSLQVGPYVLHDVECLVLPPEFGITPTLLGRGLLERFSPKIDPNQGTMTLTQLNVKPLLRGGESRR